MGREPLITYYIIPHTHWDREWYLTFDHFRVLLVHLIDDLLRILDQRDDYDSFLLDGQTIVVDDYLEIRPERRYEIERLVRSGRLVMGPWYVLPDSFLVSGEALVRNLMRGRSTAQSLGGSMNVGYIPDSFGHTAQIPQILRGFGIDTALIWRGFGGEPGQEGSEYRWRSPDGSEVLAEHLPDTGYSGAYFNGVEAAESRFSDVRQRIDSRARTAVRLVLSGGDHHWPTAGLSEVIELLNEHLHGEARVEHSSLPEFFGALQRETSGMSLPVIEGELRFGYRWAYNVTGGVYSSRMPLKQSNAAAQRMLERYLEPMDALSVNAGGPSQHALLRQGWSYLLQNHPHDSICGCSVDEVHREMITRFEKLSGLAAGVERFTWMHLDPDAEGQQGDDRHLTFFNPSPFARDEVVTCDISFFRQEIVVGLNPDVVPDPPLPPVGGFVLEDSKGASIPFEVVGRREGTGIDHTRYGYPSQSHVERFNVRLPLTQLPPLGLRTLRVRRTDGFGSEGSSAIEGGYAIENAYVHVEARRDGSFVVTDRDSGRTYGPLGYFEDGGDAGDEYNWSPPKDDVVLHSIDGAVVEVDAPPGRFAQALRVKGRWRLPSRLESGESSSRRGEEKISLDFTTTARITPFSRHVLFETEVENTIEDHRLRVIFETGLRTEHHHADNAFAVLSRTRQEFDAAEFRIEVPAAVAPMHRFVTVEDETAGATLIADGLPEYELKKDGSLALTLLRCVGELSRGDLTMRPGGYAGWPTKTPDAQCPGKHHFRYAFLPHGPHWVDRLGVIHRAAESVLLPIRCRPGRLDETAADRSFLEVDSAVLVLSAFKTAEDGEGFVLRLYNPSPMYVEGRVRTKLTLREVRRSDLEENAGEPVPLEAGAWHDHWPPYRIHTYRLYTTF